jgi:hypothetical protein
LEPFTLIIRSLSASPAKRMSALFVRIVRPAYRPSEWKLWCGLAAVLVTSIATLAVTGCGTDLYQFPQYNFAGRPIPPSKLSNRVLVGLTSGTTGALEILDAQRDIRNNVRNANSTFSVTGYAGNNPSMFQSFPAELRGYVYSNATPYPIVTINYGTEASSGTAATLNSPASSYSTASDFIRFYSAQESTGQLLVSDASTGGSYALNLPNVYRVVANPGGTIALAMVRNSDTLYRVVKLNINSLAPPGNVDCQPTILPVYCVVPVPGTYDRPVSAQFALDGSNAYIVNCGVECGGGANGGAQISLIPEGPLEINQVPTAVPYPAVITNTVPVPGGATVALADGTNLYVAGQQLQPDGLFSGFLTTINLTSLVPTAPVSISDGYHTKLLFADDNTLWVGSSACANGERAKLGLNYNCLSRYDLGAGTAAVVPAIVPATSSTVATVPYPNSSENTLYLGSLTGLCWVQNLHKVYTAYGGQIHAFNTVDGTEINNQFITVQGTALDVAYMDAVDDKAN